MYGGSGNDIIHGEDDSDFLHGDAGIDEIYGGTGDDFLFGEGGDDILDGGQDADQLRGGDGNDQLFGGAGDDVLLGGDGELQQGDDTLTGGSGSDRFYFWTDAGNDVVTDFEIGVDKIDLRFTDFTGWNDLFTPGDRYFEQVGNNVVIHHYASTMTLNNVLLGNLSQTDFIFGPPDLI
jgi:Ca2+-binding RTX toxin-like protein